MKLIFSSSMDQQMLFYFVFSFLLWNSLHWIYRIVTMRIWLKWNSEWLSHGPCFLRMDYHGLIASVWCIHWVLFDVVNFLVTMRSFLWTILHVIVRAWTLIKFWVVIPGDGQSSDGLPRIDSACPGALIEFCLCSFLVCTSESDSSGESKFAKITFSPKLKCL